MIRRCIWKFSSIELPGRRHRIIAGQSPFILSSRHEFSSFSSKNSAPRKPAAAGSVDEASKSTKKTPKLVLGSILVGAAVIGAYQAGYLKFHGKDESSSLRSSTFDTDNIAHPVDHKIHPSNEYPSESKPNLDSAVENMSNNVGNAKKNVEVLEPNVQNGEVVPSKEEKPAISFENAASTAGEKPANLEALSKENPSNNVVTTYIKSNQEEAEPMEQKEEFVNNSLYNSKEDGMEIADSHQDLSSQEQKDSMENATTEVKTLSKTYSVLVDESSSKEHKNSGESDAIPNIVKDKEAFVSSSDNMERPDDVKLVLDFLEAIHIAERKQAESDAAIFAEEKRRMKEKYDKELKDARARQLMYAEEAAILEKELHKERTKAAATIKSIHEQAEQKLREELQLKKEEADVLLREAQDLAKAELAAAIANEKASQIEKIAEANLNINALCMAFYARSEEARQTHSVHKLSLGTLALEDALSKGLPFRPEIDALYKCLEDIEQESLPGLALSSLPDEIIDFGLDTPRQLNQKFDGLKGSLRHFSLIPAGGGGLLAHAVAYIASSIKMPEDGSSEGIESIISRVESFLAEMKYAEAANTLEEGVRGTEAELVAVEWSRLARNRAVAEQALSLLKSCALSVNFG